MTRFEEKSFMNVSAIVCMLLLSSILIPISTSQKLNPSPIKLKILDSSPKPKEILEFLSKNYGHMNLNTEKWISSFGDLSRYGDKEITSKDFIDGDIKHFKEEKFAEEKLKEIIKNENRPVYRVELLNKEIIKEEWIYLTEKRKRWEVLHFLYSIEKFREDNFMMEEVRALENVCYLLWNDINNWKLASMAIYGIKALEDLKYGPRNKMPSPNIKEGTKSINVDLHIVAYYTPSGDCNDDPDISFDVTIGGSSYTWDGPSDDDDWSGDVIFSTTTTSSSVSITIHTRERDSGLCGGDDDFGTASLTYYVNTKKWSGSTSLPKVSMSGADGSITIWFHIQSDCDNNNDVITEGSTVKGYIIDVYDGVNYYDSSDTYKMSIDQSYVDSRWGIYLEVTPENSLDCDLYLYDSNSVLKASSTSSGSGGTESIFYRLQPTDPSGVYYAEIKVASGYGVYSLTYQIYQLVDFTIEVTGLQSETSTVTYKKMGTTYQHTLTSSSSTFSDFCDYGSQLTISVPQGLYTYDPTSYTMTNDTTIVVHFYRTPIKIVINEISASGTGNSEWIEIYNDGSETVYINGWKITDQDGNVIVLPDTLEPMPPNTYLMIYMGSGTNDYKFSDDGIARLYMNSAVNVLNEDGDDITILYEPGDKVIDYVAYSRGYGDEDIDSIPSGGKFVLDGLGANGYAPAPYPGGSISLIPHGQDRDRAYDWYVSNSTSKTPESRNVNALNVSGIDHAPAEIGTGSTDVLIEGIYMEAIGGNMNVSQITVHLVGNASDSDISAIYLYKDADNSGGYSSGDSLVKSTTFSNGVATFTGFVIPLSSGEHTYLFLVVDIADSPSAYGHAFSLVVRAEDIVLSPITDVVVIRNPVASSQSTIVPTDYTPPEVESVLVDPSKNVQGTAYVNRDFIVYFTFNEDMKINVEPDITVSSNNLQISSRGWQDKRTYWVSFSVSEGIEENVDISIQNAEDIAGNPSHKYTLRIRVDTLNPQVIQIMFDKYSEYNGKIYVSKNFTLKLMFSEAMNLSSIPQIVFEPSNVSSENIVWYGNSMLIMNFNISFNYSGPVNIYVANGYDLAGNSLNAFTYTFILDTVAPTAKIFVDKSSPIGPGNIHITIKFSEIMNTSLPVYINFSGKRVNGDWVNETVWEGDYSITTEYGEVKITVAGGRDIAKNVMIPANLSVIVDTRPPEISEVLYEKEVNEGSYITIKVRVSDEYSGIGKITLWYKQEGSFVSVEMNQQGDYWVATIPGSVSHPPSVEFYIVAEDTLGNSIKSSTYSINIVPWYIVMWWLWLLIAIIIILIILFIYYNKRRAKAQQIPLKESLAEKMKKKFRKEEGEYDEFYEE